MQRTASHAVVTDRTGAVMLMRPRGSGDAAGWSLPGGDVRHGEDPADAAVRVTSATGVEIAVRGVRDALADVVELPERGVRVHTLRLVYDAEAVGGAVGAAGAAEFVPSAEVPRRPLRPFAAAALGLIPAHGPDAPGPAAEPPASLGPDVTVAADVVQVQRPAAYAVLRDADRVLLTHLAHYDDMWTLPGGGIDHGEDPVVALRREVYEETGLPYTPGGLVEVSSIHFTGNAPHGRLEDFHGIRLIYDGEVPGDVTPQVTEVGGSTDRVAWVPLADIPALRVSGVVPIGLRAVLGQWP